MPERLVSIKEAAELLGVSKSRLRAWDDNGKFRAVITPGGHRRYRLSDIALFQQGKLAWQKDDSNACRD